GLSWQRSPASLGISYDLEQTVEAAYAIGRRGGPLNVLRDQFTGWYYGRPLAPGIVFDEGALHAELQEIATAIEAPALDSNFSFEGNPIAYTPGQVGRRLDVADTAERLTQPLSSFSDAEVELLVHEVRPRVLDAPDTTARIQAIV